MLEAVGRRLPTAVVDSWVRPCRLIAVEGDHLRIATPNTFSRNWLLEHHLAVLKSAAQECIGGGPPLSIEVDDRLESRAPEPSPFATPPAIAPGTVEGLNPRYTFETFVVGSSNQFAQAACQAVAELPSKAYNPLFIYGGVGLGKTHLLHAVGYQSARLFPGMVVVYITSERFTNELINAIRYDRIADIQPPDFETRVAILKKKAALERVRLGDDVAYLIASRVKSNIRELEGSLTRMIAFCALTGREMSVDLAQEVLGELWGEEEKI